MSGEIVALPIGFMAVPALLAGAGLIAAVRAGSAAERAIASLIEADLQRARAVVDAERQKVLSLRQVETDQREHGRRIAEAFALIEHATANLIEVGLNKPIEYKGSWEARSDGFLEENQPKSGEHVSITKAKFSEIRHALEKSLCDLPSHLHESVFRMDKQIKRMAERLAVGHRLYPAEIESVMMLVNDTITHLRTVAERDLTEQAAKQQWIDRLAEQEELSRGFPQAAAVVALASEIRATTGPGVRGKIAPTHIARQFDMLVSEIKKEHSTRAAWKTLATTVERSFTKMGYSVETPFPVGAHGPSIAKMRMPGGGLIRLTLQSDGKLAFKMLHETSLSGAINADGLGSFRCREQKWCSDVKHLFRELVEEGFQYNIQFERAVPDANSEVVVVEDANDWEADGKETAALNEIRRQEETNQLRRTKP